MPVSTYFTPKEIRRKSKKSDDVSTGIRVWKCCNQDRNGDWRPEPGESVWTDGLGWNPCWEDDLICTDVEFEYDGPAQSGLDPEDSEFSYCLVTANYASAQPLDSIWNVESRGQIELLKTGIGKRWRSDGSISDQSRVIRVSQETIDVSRVFAYSPRQVGMIRALKGCVNGMLLSTPWGDQFAPGCCQFLYADQNKYLDRTRKAWLNRICFHFLVQNQDHNLIWKEPRIDSEEGYWDFNDPVDYPYADFWEMFHE